MIDNDRYLQTFPIKRCSRYNDVMSTGTLKIILYILTRMLVWTDTLWINSDNLWLIFWLNTLPEDFHAYINYSITGCPWYLRTLARKTVWTRMRPSNITLIDINTIQQNKIEKYKFTYSVTGFSYCSFITKLWWLLQVHISTISDFKTGDCCQHPVCYTNALLDYS